MYEKNITNKEQGQRLDKMLQKILPEAGSAFIYKMLRKKNIKLNQKKAEGKEILKEGDLIQIFFADETLQKFMGKNYLMNAKSTTNSMNSTNVMSVLKPYQDAFKKMNKMEIIYEDENYLFVDKPSGCLTQKAEANDLSLNEWLVGYLLDSNQITAEDLTTFKPSACNRLDRNTSGLVLCAKTIKGAQVLSLMLKDRTLEKYYLAYVCGNVSKMEHLKGYLMKDHKTNQVKVIAGIKDEDSNEKLERIETAFKPLLSVNNEIIGAQQSLLLVELITGKSHQIRAHLASRKTPIIGDMKYGKEGVNKKYKEAYKVDSQMLHAYCVRFPMECEDTALAGREFKTKVPTIYQRITKENLGEETWQLGVLED